jgi:Tfp pilus assembly protein PilN
MSLKLDLRPIDYIESERKPVQLKRTAALVLVVLFAGVSLVTLIYGLVVSRSLRAERLDLQSDIDMKMVQTGKLGAELKKQQARYQDFSKALALLQKELPSVEFLGSLEQTLPTGVWLQKASLSPGKAALSGFAYTENDVVSFGRALSEVSVVSSVGFPVTTRVRQESGASVRFSLDCGIRDIMSIAADASEEGSGHGEVASR